MGSGALAALACGIQSSGTDASQSSAGQDGRPEVLIFHHFAKGKPGFINPHGSFNNPNCPANYQSRMSVEMRAIVFFPKEDKIKTLYGEVTDLKEQMEARLKLFQKLELEQDALCAPPDTKDILRQLAKGKKESFQESERLAEDWVDDGSDVDNFVKDFMEKRLVHHLRAAKIECLQRKTAPTKTL